MLFKIIYYVGYTAILQFFAAAGVRRNHYLVEIVYS